MIYMMLHANFELFLGALCLILNLRDQSILVHV